MKVIHIPYSFYPDPVGGTEVYVHFLSIELTRRGIESLIVAPSIEQNTYEYQGNKVVRYAKNNNLSLKEMYGEGDKVAEKNFIEIVMKEKPDLIHFHALTGSISLGMMRAVKESNIPIVLTYHTPTISCLRGTLLKYGTKICDGVVRSNLCISCSMHSKGLPKFVSNVFARVPTNLYDWFLKLKVFRGRLETLMLMKKLSLKRMRVFFDVMKDVDKVVATAHWVKTLLIKNNVLKSKIFVSSQGVSVKQKSEMKCSIKRDALKMVFLGRIDPTKGIDVVLKALRYIDSTQVSLDIFGANFNSEENYVHKVKEMAQEDRRVFLRTPVESDKVVECLKEYDLLVVPSQWLETGPLVVLEAFQAGIPILGSHLGGISEFVQQDVTGILVQNYAEQTAWASAIQKVIENKEILTQLKENIVPPKTMQEVAIEMDQLYRELVSVG